MTFEEDLKQIKDPAILKVGEYLKHRAATDHSVAKSIAKENKSLSECWNFIKKLARKKASHGCACVDDDEVFGWAVHYYDEDIEDIEEKKAGSEMHPILNDVEQVNKKKPKKLPNKDHIAEGQVSLF